MNGNDEDVRLLYEDPRRLLVKHQPTVRRVVDWFVASGRIPSWKADDAVQSVCEKLMWRMPAMQQQYRHTAALSTYLIAVIKNMCREIARADRPSIYLTEEYDVAVEGDSIGDAIIVGETVEVFTGIIGLYGRQSGKVWMFLKLRARLSPSLQDLTAAYPAAAGTSLRAAKVGFNVDLGLWSEEAIFSHAASWFNLLEGTTTSGDGYRRWAGEKAREVLQLLQARFPTARFEAADIRTLLELAAEKAAHEDAVVSP